MADIVNATLLCIFSFFRLFKFDRSWVLAGVKDKRTLLERVQAEDEAEKTKKRG